MLAPLRPALVFLGGFTLLLGIVIPLAFTALAEAMFPHQASGSLVRDDGRVIGSALIAQRFDGQAWFHPRPSAAGREGFDATSSGASNLGATSAQLLVDVQARIAALGFIAPVPVDAVTASGSGLDPHLSPTAAQAQVARVAAVRGLEEARVAALVAEHIEPRLLGLLGEPRVNIIMLNRALAGLN
jgi:K+-transporting ATPase ATPase C chain